MICACSEEVLNVDLYLALKSDGGSGVNVQTALFASVRLVRGPGLIFQKQRRNRGKGRVIYFKSVLSWETDLRGRECSAKHCRLNRIIEERISSLSMHPTSSGEGFA
jgi:hypothetical protein